MNIAFIHQNMPAQFLHLTRYFARFEHDKVAFITQKVGIDIKNVLRTSYNLKLPKDRSKATLGSMLTTQSLFGEAVIRTLQALSSRGFKPDIVIGHPGWGELLFVKDLLPHVPLLSYCEFYNDPTWPLVTGDPPVAPSLERRMDLRSQSAHLLLSLEAADAGWSPTVWQKDLHPKALQNKIRVIFDGVDTALARPDPDAVFRLPDGHDLTRRDEVITFTARSLEPSRGFPSFMRALPTLLTLRPQAQVVIAGDEAPHYDRPPSAGGTWRAALEREAPVDAERVHFIGRVPHSQFLKLLQVSSAHVHLTHPTVLSWSLVEAMSVGCLVVASTTPAVLEVMNPEETGLATSFGDPDQLAYDIERALVHPRRENIKSNARKFVVSNLGLDVCLPKQVQLIEEIMNSYGQFR